MNPERADAIVRMRRRLLQAQFDQAKSVAILRVSPNLQRNCLGKRPTATWIKRKPYQGNMHGCLAIFS